MNYRIIYKQNYGPIPKDNDGISFDIHHKDGNHANNHPHNLMALQIEDHLQIHIKQGDIQAAGAIVARMKNRDSYSAYMQLNGHIGGMISKKFKLGAFALTTEQKKEIGKIIGKRSVEEKFGLFGRTKEKCVSDSSNGGKMSALKKVGFHDPNKNGYNFVRGTKWFNNGMINKRCKISPGIEWKEGML